MPSDFWSGWIVVLTVTGTAALLWFVVSIYFGKAKSIYETPPVWDETLTEGEAPAPMWWFWTILSALVISVIYLMLYPGLGSFAGLLEWSQSQDLERSQARFEQNFAVRRAELLEMPLSAAQQDPIVMASAYRVFREHCAACHGKDAGGQANTFPSLADGRWQWGGEPAQIEQSIVAGRTATMPDWSAVIGEEGVTRVADHVAGLAGSGATSEEGAQLYATYCIACHGVDGAGNVLLGGPDLTDQASVYGNDHAALVESIAHGRQGEMPAFGERLDAVQVRMLVAWLSQTRQ